MPVITVTLDQEQIDRADELAAKLTKRYGVLVSRAAVIRRAITAYQPYDLHNEKEEEDNDRNPA